jgi:membrane protein DedA with SNARE-associated domain
VGPFLSILFGTFILEDVALASSVALVSENRLSLLAAFFACSLGIGIGDVSLYFMGYGASRFEIKNRFRFLARHRVTLGEMKNSPLMPYSILVSRVIPGTRLPTYFGAGFLHYPFWNFFLLTLVSVSLWVSIALLAGRSIHAILMGRWLLSIAIFLFSLQIMKALVPKLADCWERRALIHSWRRWTHFEFWPASVFYIPIVPYYIFLSIKHKSVFMPFYASPHIKNGGLLGESKWEFLRYLNSDGSSTLRAIRIGKDLDFMATRELLDVEGIEYPFIMKPDVGQRGFGVRIIRNDFDLTEYLLLSDFAKIAQRLSELPREAGLFYVRKPSESVGRIFSVTDKKFPCVIGDGKTKLGSLILADARARIIAPTYFARFRKRLDSIPEKEAVVVLAECGNHCQGAIFQNGKDLISEELTRELDRIAKQIPDFYFGRFDVRYQDAESLMSGTKFEIVEINGAGSEATHIWDARTRLPDAYRTLFEQWRMLFAIGDEVSRLPNKKSRIKIGAFLAECAKVIFRKERLSISS